MKTFTFRGRRLALVEQHIEFDVKAKEHVEAMRIAEVAMYEWPEITDNNICNALVVQEAVVDVPEIDRVASVRRKTTKD